MFKYAIQFANTTNSFPNLDFDNRYVGTANFLGIFGICMTHKSLLVVFRVDDSDAIQGRDSGCDSEGVNREKTVNR